MSICGRGEHDRSCPEDGSESARGRKRICRASCSGSSPKSGPLRKSQAHVRKTHLSSWCLVKGDVSWSPCATSGGHDWRRAKLAQLSKRTMGCPTCQKREREKGVFWKQRSGRRGASLTLIKNHREQTFSCGRNAQLCGSAKTHSCAVQICHPWICDVVRLTGCTAPTRNLWVSSRLPRQ